ncbi:MAG: group 1 truncated hemoglobin [Thiothrix sp.]|uniref:group I truncated hemoglobin n=1 Tax=Thiothrix sp. TaxID=1032 RepID=UPI002603C578|nr:group 1 truncated hemoglobin [Thiothrix sp.]MDD5391954.1 group 1 truncated hemoglobin [Thiothrix sp.]
MTASLYERIGGKDAVNAAVDRFYEIMLADERVKHFFADTNMDKQRQHQKNFVSVALGGPNNYDGRDMREGHRHLVEKLGLNDSHFDATVENLVQALQELNVPENLIAELGAVLETTRNDVLCR